jgi:hypothetical protein
MSGKNYFIEPPPDDKGCEPSLRVVYEIDVYASDAHAAAESVWRIIKAPDSMPPVLTVIDVQGKRTVIDLAAGR